MTSFPSFLFLFSFLFYFFKIIYLFIYLWLCWVLVSVRGLPPVAASGGHSSSRCAGLSLSWPPLLRSTGSRRAGSAIVAHRPSCSAACGILPDQGSNSRPLHWQADSQPLRHQGSPFCSILFLFLLSQVQWCSNFGCKILNLSVVFLKKNVQGLGKCRSHASLGIDP